MNQRTEFLSIFPNCTGSALYIAPQLLQGQSDGTKIHSAIWKFFTLVAPSTKNRFATADDWIRILNEKRASFYKLKEKYFVKPNEDNDIDPLLASQDSEWSQFFSDQELRTQIAKDTNRTFQELEFFQQQETLKNLEDILFLFCRTHPDYEYAQGLHEICGVIYYVFSNEMKSDEKDPISCIFNVNSVVPDTYFTFAAVAEALKPLYAPTAPGASQSFCAELAEKIQGPMLSKISPRLARHLEECNVAPQTYMVQWLRLLFLRIFDLDGIVTMWDILLAYLPDLSIISNTALAIIMNAENTLLANDTIGVLGLLFHYPKVPNPARFAVKGVEFGKKNVKPPGEEDIKLAVAARLNDLARSLSEVCQKNGFDAAMPYVMDLRRTRDLLLGILPLDEMLPLEQAVALFSPATVEMKVVVEEKEEEKKEETKPIEMPKAGKVTKATKAEAVSLLFEEDDKPKKKKIVSKKKPGTGLFD